MLKLALIDMIIMHAVQMIVVNIVNVITVLNGGMSTSATMLVIMIVVFAATHYLLFLLSLLTLDYFEIESDFHFRYRHSKPASRDDFQSSTAMPKWEIRVFQLEIRAGKDCRHSILKVSPCLLRHHI